MKDLLQVITGLIAVIGGLIAVFKALDEMRQSRIQRKIELRWKQANLAREILDSAFENKYFENAVSMLDLPGRKFKFGDSRTESINLQDIVAALESDDPTHSDKLVFIRDCFDYLFFYMNRIEQAIETNLIFIEDVKQPFSFLVGKMIGNRHVFEEYMKENGYNYAMKFLNRLGF